MNETVIEVKELTRNFGAQKALNSVSLLVPRGSVYGLVGENGAGKTTLIKHLLGLLRAESGSVRVFGYDPVADPVAVLSRIGYLSEDNDLPVWMRVGELMRYSRAFYPAWDEAYAEELRQTFALDPNSKIKNLSKGQKARAGLLIALSYRPELLVLDEPSSGLDPIVRRDILGAVIRTIAEEGRTVIFSSHLLEEVEQIADHVTMISRGQIALSAPLRVIKESHRCATVRFVEACSHPPTVVGVLRWERVNGSNREWTAMYRGGASELHTAFDRLDGAPQIIAERIPSLDEIFVAHVGTSCSPTQEA